MKKTGKTAPHPAPRMSDARRTYLLGEEIERAWQADWYMTAAYWLAWVLSGLAADAGVQMPQTVRPVPERTAARRIVRGAHGLMGVAEKGKAMTAARLAELEASAKTFRAGDKSAIVFLSPFGVLTAREAKRYGVK